LELKVKPDDLNSVAFSIKKNGFEPTRLAIKELQTKPSEVNDIAFSIQHHGFEPTKQALNLSNVIEKFLIMPSDIHHVAFAIKVYNTKAVRLELESGTKPYNLAKVLSKKQP
jgi:hypothetical protein